MSSRWQVLIPTGRKGETGELPRLAEHPHEDLPYAEGSTGRRPALPDLSGAAPFVIPVAGAISVAIGVTFAAPVVAIALGVVTAAAAVILVRRGHPLGRRRGTLLGGACGWVGVALGVAGLVFSGGGESRGVPLVTGQYRVTLGECRLDGEFATQEGEFTNVSDAPIAYVIELAFRDAEGGYSSGDTTIVQAVPEETVPWEANGAVQGQGSCEVTAIEPYEVTPVAP